MTKVASLSAVLREVLRSVTPLPARRLWRKWRIRRFESRMDAADHRGVFAEIYRLGGWGKGASGYFSGIGSHAPELVEPFVGPLRDFLDAQPAPLDVVDLGCGDFNVGAQVRTSCARYVACDVVPDLIGVNKTRFASADVDFRCLDIVTEALPDGDLAILRQVLQHLSNAHIERLVPKLGQYRYLVVADHQPAGSFVPNLDIPTGVRIRLDLDSGVDLVAAPFGLPVVEQRELSRVQHRSEKGEVIVTTLYRLADQTATPSER